MKFLKFASSTSKIVHIKGDRYPTLCMANGGDTQEFDHIPSKYRLCGHCRYTYERLNPKDDIKQLMKTWRKKVPDKV